MGSKIYLEAKKQAGGYATPLVISGLDNEDNARVVRNLVHGKKMPEVREIVKSIHGLKIEMRHGAFNNEEVGATVV